MEFDKSRLAHKHMAKYKNFTTGNIDGLALFRSLTGKILTDSLFREPVFAIQLEIESKNFDGLLVVRQIRQYSPLSPFKILYYTVTLLMAHMFGGQFTQLDYQLRC